MITPFIEKCAIAYLGGSPKPHNVYREAHPDQLYNLALHCYYSTRAEEIHLTPNLSFWRLLT